MINRNKLFEFCNGDSNAVSLILDFHSLFCTWDDCIDQDKPMIHNRINSAFIWALFGMESNPFYVLHKEALKASALSCVALWIAANDFEGTNEKRLLHQSFVMRCSPYNLYGLIVLLSGGMTNHIESLKYFYSLNEDDSLESYLTEHKGV